MSETPTGAFDVQEGVERLEELLEMVAGALELDADIYVEHSEGVITGRLEGEALGLFIGRRGQMIDAVQHLAQRIVVRDVEAGVRVVIDADGYRARRAEALRAEADEAAEDALASGEAIELEPMPASERRVVHEHLRDRDDVETHSDGVEPERYLVIRPAAG